MWNLKRSLMLSRVCTLVCGAALLGVLLFAPSMVGWFVDYSNNAEQMHVGFFLASIYTGGALAALLLVFLYKLLHNISAEEVFVAKNIKLLRGISWLCIGGAVICAFSALYYLPWGLVGLAAVFVGLIVRVVKNVMAQAVQLKEENDYTI